MNRPGGAPASENRSDKHNKMIPTLQRVAQNTPPSSFGSKNFHAIALKQASFGRAQVH